jgi:large subunit ribosomal protein L18
MQAQLIDDLQGRTLASVSTLKLDGKRLNNGSNVEAARKVGKAIAEMAVAQGVKRVIFDRGGYLYHGRVQAVAEGAREGGLEF